MTIVVWMCPNCGSYYAASGAKDLAQEWNTDKKGQRTFRRSRCPSRDCAVQDIHREPKLYVQAPHAMVKDYVQEFQ